MGYHYTFSRMTKIKKTDNVKKWHEDGVSEIFICWWCEHKLAKLLGKIALQYLKQWIICLSYGPEIALPDLFPREISAFVHQKHVQEHSRLLFS